MTTRFPLGKILATPGGVQEIAHPRAGPCRAGTAKAQGKPLGRAWARCPARPTRLDRECEGRGIGVGRLTLDGATAVARGAEAIRPWW